ncbi:DNA (cytosine-5-)-methyltransferase [Bifidobacterium sp. ESL0790]|uniref:DNA (cytosine-5-)-methyltransferase n=1 Tax=Bifidobacterium sp. ESL0790 TaxID=2983233 RepID=UPI0023F7E418|nr:DNA (cytosine-5-)-methyltransferase [Bifidobacterium sp. ESL0790]WEV72757.1 DNA (cytosine-5-)-methyltransferase [Bifidobacterium sp. ESL0790]
MAKEIKVAEMFAGVGGFRLGLDGYDDPEHKEFQLDPAGPFKTIWANQWEPMGSPAKQFAWRCYEHRFGEGSCINEDITKVLDEVEAGNRKIPDFDMLVGGFPCQDYSVARTLSQAGGIEGKKGVLWWQIRRMLQLKHPKYVLLENVDRLLKSPASQRGRDFAIILSCFTALGYSVEWRVINAADYGMPQKRRRTYIYAEALDEKWDLQSRISTSGVMRRAFPITADDDLQFDERTISEDTLEVSEHFGVGDKISFFENAGAMQDDRVVTCKVQPDFHGHRTTLREILVPDKEVPESYYIDSGSIAKWQYLKGAKHEERVTSKGFKYNYSEGSMGFPDDLDKPSRTILTSEGGSGPSRMKHVVMAENGSLRRLVPDELDQLQMFPKGWTNDGMSDGHRAFCMGNALVVGIPHRIGQVIAEDIEQIKGE